MSPNDALKIVLQSLALYTDEELNNLAFMASITYQDRFYTVDDTIEATSIDEVKDIIAFDGGAGS